MRKVLYVAAREITSTVLTKAFIIGMLMTPAIIVVMILVLPRLIDEEAPKIDGEVAIVDPTSSVAAGVHAYLLPEAIARRRDDEARRLAEELPANLRGFAPQLDSTLTRDEAVSSLLGEVPELYVTVLPWSADIEAEKAYLLEGTAQDGGRLALVVVHPNAVEPGAGGSVGWGSYDFFVREKLDDRLMDEIGDAVRQSVLTARIESQGFDTATVRALTRLPRVPARAVTAQGEMENTEILNILLPIGFMLLLWMSSLTGGQYLLTTTIEEKSSRVVEVLLAAVSPMELMAGKILGQLVVGLLVLALYAGIGVAGLASFSLFGLVDPWLIVYLLIFFLIAYFTFGAFMAAVGAAVNEQREAQTLMMPIMIVMMIPMLLWMPITRNPESLFAVVTSLLPPISPFAMLLRMTSTTPPPLWQVWLSIAIGAVAVWGAVWFAAKVFRIGLLMHGKPPNLATLVKWVRMA